MLRSKLFYVINCYLKFGNVIVYLIFYDIYYGIYRVKFFFWSFGLRYDKYMYILRKNKFLDVNCVCYFKIVGGKLEKLIKR